MQQRICIQQRIFLALLPPQKTRDALVETQQLVTSHLHPLKQRPTRRENLHLTLIFLGMCNAAQIHAIKRVLQSVAGMHTPFDLVLGSLDCFTKKRGGDIVWRGLTGDLTSLYHMQADLKNALIREELLTVPPAHSDLYRPHVTLFRSVRCQQHSPVWTLADALTDLNHSLPQASWHVSSVSLMWSHRPAETGMLTYDELMSVNLDDMDGFGTDPK